MTFQNWGFTSMSTFAFDRSVLFGLYPSVYHYLKNPLALDCEGEDERGLTDCFKEETRKGIRLRNITCIPNHLVPFDTRLRVMDNFFKY